MPRLLRGLYPSPRERFGRPEGGLNLHRLVDEARNAGNFHRLFGEFTNVVDIVQSAAQRQGWAIPRAEILEAMEESNERSRTH